MHNLLHRPNAHTQCKHVTKKQHFLPLFCLLPLSPAGNPRAQNMPHWNCKTCTNDHMLAVMRSVDGDDIGMCLDPTSAPVNDCIYSRCTNGKTGMALGKGGTQKDIVCSRICKFGLSNTRVKNLMRKNANGIETVNATFKDSKGFSAPHCLFSKIVRCHRSDTYNSEECAKCKTNTDREGCVKNRCEDCKVEKTVMCHAILAFEGGNVSTINDAQE